LREKPKPKEGKEMTYNISQQEAKERCAIKRKLRKAEIAYQMEESTASLKAKLIPQGMRYRRACAMMGIDPDNNPNYETS